MKPGPATLDWNAIWDVLVRECGARAEALEYFCFVARHHYSKTNGLEYRFQGHLGFGGKLYVDAWEGLRVRCYPEDETPERLAMCKRADEALAAIWKAAR